VWDWLRTDHMMNCCCLKVLKLETAKNERAVGSHKTLSFHMVKLLDKITGSWPPRTVLNSHSQVAYKNSLAGKVAYIPYCYPRHIFQWDKNRLFLCEAPSWLFVCRNRLAISTYDTIQYNSITCHIYLFINCS
jgi:hypothetical protein